MDLRPGDFYHQGLKMELTRKMINAWQGGRRCKTKRVLSPGTKKGDGKKDDQSMVGRSQAI